MDNIEFKKKVFGLRMKMFFTWIVLAGLGLFVYGMYPTYNPIFTASAIMFVLLGSINAISFEKKYKLTKQDMKWYSKNMRSILTFRGKVPYEEETGNK